MKSRQFDIYGGEAISLGLLCCIGWLIPRRKRTRDGALLVSFPFALYWGIGGQEGGFGQMGYLDLVAEVDGV